MDSIFEQPRTTPRPTPVSQNFQLPVVPEASLIFQNESKGLQSQKTTQILPPQQQSYNAWKLHNIPQPDNDSFVFNNKPLSESTNSDKICQNYANYQYAFNKGSCDTSTNRSMLKKQVRFERANIQQTAIVRSPNFSALLKNSTEKSDMKNEPVSKQYIPQINNSRFPNNNNINNDSLINMSKSVKKRVNEPNYKKPHQEQLVQQNFNGNNANNIRDSNILQMKHQTLGGNSERCENTKSENLFQKSTLNSENIKKFALPEHILGQEKLKTVHNVEIGNCDSSPHQTLPNCFEPILPSKPIDIMSYTTNSHDLGDQSQKNKVENFQNSDKSCTCNCNSKSVEKNSENNENLEPKSDPTVSELLNIVKLQNEQLQLLQNQVQTLIALNEKNRKDDLEKTVQAIAKYNPKTVDKQKDTTRLDKYQDIQRLYKRYEGENSDSDKNYGKNKKKSSKNDQSSKNKVIIYKDEQVGTSYDEGFCRRVRKENILTKDTKNDKVSVGIMTSFQVSVKPPYKNPTKRYESTEISSTEDSYSSYSNQMFNEIWRDNKERYTRENDQDSDYSLDEMSFDESLKVQEPPLSPNHTVHVDMQDYITDSDDESSCSYENPGWTFYDNILGHVNNILENSPSPNARRQTKGNRIAQSNKATNRTMDVIKEEALKKIQQQGLCGSSNDFLDMNPEEVSFAVKQILMKYMSDEELASIAQKHDKKSEQNIPDGQNHYKKEYKSSRDHHRRGNNHGKQAKYNVKSKSSNRNGNILDITTLKKQPKLL